MAYSPIIHKNFGLRELRQFWVLKKVDPRFRNPEYLKLRHIHILPWISARALSAGLACLIAFARSTKSCSREEGGTPVAKLEGDPPDGGPLVSGTVENII